MSVPERLLLLSGCQTVRFDNISGGVIAYTDGGQMRAQGFGRTPYEAMCSALGVAAGIATTVAESKHVAELERIKKLATVEPEEDPRDARIRELERQLAEERAKTCAVAAALGAT